MRYFSICVCFIKEETEDEEGQGVCLGEHSYYLAEFGIESKWVQLQDQCTVQSYLLSY